MKLFKCDFIYARSFRNATGGARVQRNQNLNDPPPSIFASHNDWYNVACSLSRWWKLGLEQQSIILSDYSRLPYKEKLVFQNHVRDLLKFQMIQYCKVWFCFDCLRLSSPYIRTFTKHICFKKTVIQRDVLFHTCF